MFVCSPYRHLFDIIYVDHCLWLGKDGAALDFLTDEMKRKMDLKVGSNDVCEFLGINVHQMSTDWNHRIDTKTDWD
jgi:hypothetical protein